MGERDRSTVTAYGTRYPRVLCTQALLESACPKGCGQRHAVYSIYPSSAKHYFARGAICDSIPSSIVKMDTGRSKNVNKQVKLRNSKGAVIPMDYIDKILENLKDIARKLIEILLGPEAEPERETIPIPVDNRQRRNYR